MGGTGRKRRVADSLPRYLERRARGVYGCRLDIPKRLRSLLGKSKFVISHETTDLATALIRHKPVVARLLGLLEFADAALASAPPRLTPVQIQATARQIAELYVARYQVPPLVTPGWAPQPEHPLLSLIIPTPDKDTYSEMALAEVRDYRLAVESGAEALAAWQTSQLHQAQELLSRVWHPDDSVVIAMAHHRARVLALGTAAGRHLDWDRYLGGTAAIEAMPDPEVVLPVTAGGGGVLTIEALVERWIQQRQPAPKTAVAVRRIATALAAVAGTTSAHQIDVSLARRYRDSRLEDVAARTAGKELGLLRTSWSWAVGEELVPANPWLSVRLGRGDTGVEPRLPFSTEQVALILKRSAELQDPAMRWSWPLGLMLGLRIEEICCLRRQDLQMRDGVLCVVVDPEAQLAGRLKTRSSERVVPLPAALLAIGFWEWGLAQRGGHLFDAPSVPAADPRRSHSLSIRNGKALRAWGITSKRLVFHSCRHSFSARAVAAGLPDRLIQTLMGHSTGKSMTARYSGAFTIAQLQAGIDQIPWPSVSMESSTADDDGDSGLGPPAPRKAIAAQRRTTATTA